MVYERCYLCGSNHVVKERLPDQFKSYKEAREVMDNLREYMRQYHREYDWGIKISNWLAQELAEDFDYDLGRRRGQ